MDGSGDQECYRPRRVIRLPDASYRGAEPFLLTMCTARKTETFLSESYATAATNAMSRAASDTGANLWCGVVMPDHAHLLVNALPGKTPLDVAACFKRLVTLALRALGVSGGVWQRRIHDRGMRGASEKELLAAVYYVLDNPVRKGLVAHWQDWPYRYLHPDIV
jgi:putative transposase